LCGGATFEVSDFVPNKPDFVSSPNNEVAARVSFFGTLSGTT
jgi:hypothetical protein